MSDLFGAAYASTYDEMYREKDYDHECDLVEKLTARYLASGPKNILDLGCGTGNHAVRLAARGHRVVGVDRSPEMLARARRKAEESAVELDLREGDLRSFRSGAQHDVVLMLFAVLGYQTSNADVRAALDTAHSHLVQGGLLIFDVWYGPAVLMQGTEQRFRAIEENDGTLLKASSATVDPRSHTAAVDMRLWFLRKNEVVSRSHERHTMRFFFPLELEFFGDQTGFEIDLLAPFPDLDAPLDASAWNVVCVARAR